MQASYRCHGQAPGVSPQCTALPLSAAHYPFRLAALIGARAAQRRSVVIAVAAPALAVVPPAPAPADAPPAPRVVGPGALEVSDPEALGVAVGAQRLVRCGPTPLGRGLVAKQQLDRQCIVSVPLQNALIITDEPMSGISVFGDRCQELWQEHHGQMPEQLQEFIGGEARWDVRMTAYLLWVTADLPDSPVWAPYIANLPPADEVSCLINYDPDTARELQIKALVEEAKTQHNWALGVHRKYFDAERGELRALKLASRPQDTQWAMSMVRTRTFSETVNGEDLTLMVPYADLANHSFRPNATFCMSRDFKRFELKLLTALAAGEEAIISYGESKPNAEVMRDYGFVVPGNPNDRIQIPNQEKLPPLHGASIMESIGFKGDWREGTAAPKRPTLEAADGDAVARLVLSRRRCVLLSMTFTDGLSSTSSATTGAGSSSSSSNAGGGGGLFGSWPPKPWTDAGRAPPQHVPSQPRALTAERDNVAVVRQSYQTALDELPTTISTDLELLAAHESRELPLSGLTVGAIRYRLEHKLLLAEAVVMLDVYDAWLAGNLERRLKR